MAKDLEVSSKKSRGIKRVRTSDDVELIKLIIEDDPPLFAKVVYILETSLGKRARIESND